MSSSIYTSEINSRLERAEAPQNVVARERNELRSIGIQFLSGTRTGSPAGQTLKRKEPGVSEPPRTVDPRKRQHTESPESLRRKIADQEQYISELEQRRKSDEAELSSMRSCLKDLLGKAEVNQKMIQKLAADKAVAARQASIAWDVSRRDMPAVARTISKLQSRNEYLEKERQKMKADVRRYRTNALEVSMHYKLKSKMQKEWDQVSRELHLVDENAKERVSYAPEPGRR